MLKKLLLASCLFVSINIQAQNADVRIGQLINESNWFELEHELKATPQSHADRQNQSALPALQG